MFAKSMQEQFNTQKNNKKLLGMENRIANNDFTKCGTAERPQKL